MRALGSEYLRSCLYLTAVFLNWCNGNPDQIAKSNCLWLRGSVSLKLNPFLRVFSISAFLKVIHAPKTPKNYHHIAQSYKIIDNQIFIELQKPLKMIEVMKHYLKNHSKCVQKIFNILIFAGCLIFVIVQGSQCIMKFIEKGPSI